MTNWCSTAVAITGDKLQLDDLFCNMKTALSCGLHIQNLIDQFDLNGEGFSGRGELIEMPAYGNGAVVFCCETAYGPYAELWGAILALYPSLDYVYVAEDRDDGLFINTDIEGRFFRDRYMISVEDEDDCYLENVTELCNKVSALTGMSPSDEDECWLCVQNFNESEDNISRHIRFYKFES